MGTRRMAFVWTHESHISRIIALSNSNNMHYSKSNTCFYWQPSKKPIKCRLQKHTFFTTLFGYLWFLVSHVRSYNVIRPRTCDVAQSFRVLGRMSPNCPSVSYAICAIMHISLNLHPNFSWLCQYRWPFVREYADCAPWELGEAVERTVEWPVIWDVMATNVNAISCRLWVNG